MYPPKWNSVLHSPTTPCPFDMWNLADIPKWDVSPLFDPSASEPYYTISIWHVEACRHTQMRSIPPNWSQCFIALLHHICLTWGSMQTYWNEMYPPNQTQCFRALLHHVCLTCGSMQTYPNEMYPPNQTQCFIAVLHHVHLTCGSLQTYPNEMYPP